MVIPNPPLTGRPGRPRALECKRGHARQAGQLSCVPCRRMRERMKYDTNPEFKDKKLVYQRQWRRDFFTTNGFHASEARP